MNNKACFIEIDDNLFININLVEKMKIVKHFTTKSSEGHHVIRTNDKFDGYVILFSFISSRLVESKIFDDESYARRYILNMQKGLQK